MTERYTHGHHGSVVASHVRRTAADSAGFILDRLEPSMRLLDIGCGPGSITVDLADRVASAVGIDASGEAIARANEIAGERADVRFQVASVYELPFPDDSFDVVYAHQVLQHLADPVAALVEARRVVVPGGFVAARDADYGTMVHDPHETRIDRWAALYDAVARRNGGEPNAGRKLGGWFSAAGFETMAVSTSTWTYSTPGTVGPWVDLWVSRLTEARLADLALEYGLADRAELEELADGWRAWGSSPHPFFAFLHGEVIGTV
jgi:ubiquinone/menaquinone biosynthesis C-methylase UbiE